MANQLRLLILVFLVLVSSVAAGADKSPWYKVELIVFARPNAALDSEHWPVEVTPPPAGRDLVAWRGYTGPDSLPFQRLPTASLQLKRDFDRMQAAKDVQPLVHVGWLQPGLAKEEAVAVNVRSDAGSAGWVEGSLRLVLARYLHLETNLIYHQAGENAAVPGGPVFQLVESRRMRSREYHYLDHPLFGVLVVVTPYELPAAKPASPAAR
jgi:hypothetical protein